MKTICKVSDDCVSILDKYQNILHKIDIKNIIDFEIIEDVDYIEKKKSTVCRTIFGGLIAGSTGAVIGAVSGLIPEFKEKKTYFLEIICTNEDENLFLSADFKTLKNIAKEILKHMN